MKFQLATFLVAFAMTGALCQQPIQKLEDSVDLEEIPAFVTDVVSVYIGVLIGSNSLQYVDNTIPCLLDTLGLQ